LEDRTLKLRTSTKQTIALIVMAWCAACASLERALKTAHELKNVNAFCCLGNFETTCFWYIDALQVKH
jgi:hypothetical protein